MNVILDLFLLTAGFLLLLMLIKQVLDNLQYGSQDKRKRSRIFAILFFLFILLPLLIVKIWPYEPYLKSETSRYNFYLNYHEYTSLNNLYSERLENDTFNLKLHYKHLGTVKSFIDENSRFHNVNSIRSSQIFRNTEQFYLDYLKYNDSITDDIGELFLALLNLYSNKTYSAEQYLAKVDEQVLNTSYGAFIQAQYYAEKPYRETYLLADSLYKVAEKDEFLLQDAIVARAALYYRYNQKNELNNLVKTRFKQLELENFYSRIVYFRTFDLVSYFRYIVNISFEYFNLWGALSALIITLVWLLYLRKLDIYEPEKWKHIILVFIMGAVFIYLVFPLKDFIYDVLRYYPTYEPVSQLIHDIVSIGLVEELVKIIPLLLLIRFSNAVNEPYDYIFYASVSALGFAFVENLSYIDTPQLYNVNARGLFSVVMHMFFSSTVAYGLVISKYKKLNSGVFFFFIFLFLAAIFHGFYDYILLASDSRHFEWGASVLLIFCIHVWHIYANNTMNITTFYKPEIKIQNDALKRFLILGLLGVLMVSFLVNTYSRGVQFGKFYVIRSLYSYGFFILYLAFSLSRFQVLRGYFKPFSAVFSMLIPFIRRESDYSGMPVRILDTIRYRFVKEYEYLRDQLPINAILENRIVVDDILESYLVKLENPLQNLQGYCADKIILIPKSNAQKLNSEQNILVHFYLIPNNFNFGEAVHFRRQIKFAGWAASSKRIVKNNIE
jgi:RsiW-degrading membrane proteinase PrsW (M82 family)